MAGEVTSISPEPAYIHIEGGTPGITGATVSISPRPAEVTITGGTPRVGGQIVTISPEPATVRIEGYTPTVTAVSTVPHVQLPVLPDTPGYSPPLPQGADLEEGWAWDWPGPTGTRWPYGGAIRTLRDGLTPLFWVGGLWETYPGAAGFPAASPARFLFEAFANTVVDPDTGTRDYTTSRLDYTRYEPINIPHSGAVYPAGMSVVEGTVELAAAINALPGDFVMMGASLGGGIVANVFDLLRGVALANATKYGTLPDITGRNADLLWAWAEASYRRQAGHMFPAGPNYCAGAGAYEPMTGTIDSRFWDWAVTAGTYPGNDSLTGVTYDTYDPVSCLGTSAIDNEARRLVGKSMQRTVFDQAEFAEFLDHAQQSPAWQMVLGVLDLMDNPHGNSAWAIQPFLAADDHRTYHQYSLDYANTLTSAGPAQQRRTIELQRFAINPGWHIIAGADVAWLNMATTGRAITVGVNYYDDDDTLIATDTALMDGVTVIISATQPVGSVIDPTSEQLDYKKLSGAYEAPNNATSAALVFDVTAEAMTGIVWFGRPIFARGMGPLQVMDYNLTLAQQCGQTWDFTRQLINVEWSLRKQQPLIRYWDAEWNLQHIGGTEYKASFSWISNDTGPGQVELPFETPAAQWIHDEDGRIRRGEGRNVCITVDYCGARWSGLMDKYAVEQRDDGDMVLVVDWMHDYEHLKWYHVFCNPFLPWFFQWPRIWMCPGPADWSLRFTLFVNVFREHFPLTTLPDDPMDGTEWMNSLDLATWHMVVQPKGFLQSMASGTAWAISISRMANFHDMAHPILEDGEISVVCKRYLNGDKPPWPGAVLRHGTLVIDFVDKSGVYIGTSHGGTIWDGLIRTLVEFVEDFIESTEVLLTDTNVPPEYYESGSKFTHKELPYVVFQQGSSNMASPIQTSAWINSPSKGVQVLCGGHSMMGVNEVISATVQFGFDLAGGLIFMGGLGGVIDTLLKPLYEDTLLAWWGWKNFARAQKGGWERLFEYFQIGGERAFTISGLLVLRAGFWATKSTVSWRVNVIDGLPFMIGDSGLGHFFLDDRVGLVLEGDSKIHMDRCRKLDLAWDDQNPPEWAINIGDERVFQDPAQRAWGKIERIVAGLRDAGVW